MSKGISPLIAAVLLIAFTMAVASLFAQWAPQLIQNAQDDASNSSDELQRCSGIAFNVISGDDESITVQQTSGEQAAGNLSATWFYSDGSTAQGFNESTNSRDTVMINSGVSGETIDEIQVSALDCEGAPPITHP